MDELLLGREAYGFEIVSKDYLTDWAANGWLLRHRMSGFEVFYVDAEDAESAFCYSFATVPHDDTGVFHILEHTLLSGSRRYPVRDPFLDLNRSSCNTFMNAMTFPERTMYPAASAHRKDFDNIFSIYTDAVFAPLLKKEAFMQEGIRIVKDEKGELRFDGVVYHEMEGAINDFESVAFRKTVEGLFEGGEYSFESGGKPKAICRLTYEEYLEAYKKHYVPANGKLLSMAGTAV
jgi:Predicted Zn-dependent peptidases, insulinase-like